MATLNREKMLSKEKLDQAFKLFDEVIEKISSCMSFKIGRKWFHFF